MKNFSKVLLIIIFTLFIAGSAQSISADHLKSNGKGIFTGQNDVNLVSEKDSKYKVHLQVVVRNAQGQLISVSETMGGKYLAHEVTDHVFDGMSDKKEVIVIDNVEYQKVQVTMTQRMEDVPMWWQQDIHSKWFIEYCISVNGQNTCGIAFASISPHIFLAEGEVLEIHWTILRAVN